MAKESLQLKIIHERIENDLKNIKEILNEVKGQTTKTNGRVGVLEDELIKVKADIANALKVISGHSTIISYYRQEKDKAQEDLIKQQQEKIEKMNLEKEQFNKRVIISIISAIGFILISLGLVNKEVFKIFLGIL